MAHRFLRSLQLLLVPGASFLAGMAAMALFSWIEHRDWQSASRKDIESVLADLPSFEPGIEYPSDINFDGTSTSKAALRPLVPVQGFLGIKEDPPEGLGGYGLLAFTSMVTPANRERYKAICQAFLSTLPSLDSVPDRIPLEELMVTYWPLAVELSGHPVMTVMSASIPSDCDYLLDKYNLLAAWEALQDAEGQQPAGRAQRRGPFLIGWAPAKSRYQQDAVVLVMDLSDFDSPETFVELFQRWRTRVSNRELFDDGFTLEEVRIAFRDLLDKYGSAFIQVIGIKPN